MRARSAAVLAVTIGAVAAGAALAQSPPSPNRTFSCTLTLRAHNAPYAISGENWGPVVCRGGLGRGVHRDTYKATIESQTAGTVTGTFRDYFNTGTLKGSFTLDYTITAEGRVTYTGTFGYTSGTGSLKAVRAVGPMTGTTADGIHSTMTTTVTTTE